jgi:hypothetical protein
MKYIKALYHILPSFAIVNKETPQEISCGVSGC